MWRQGTAPVQCLRCAATGPSCWPRPTLLWAWPSAAASRRARVPPARCRRRRANRVLRGVPGRRRAADDNLRRCAPSQPPPRAAGCPAGALAAMPGRRWPAGPLPSTAGALQGHRAAWPAPQRPGGGEQHRAWQAAGGTHHHLGLPKRGPTKRQKRPGQAGAQPSCFVPACRGRRGPRGRSRPLQAHAIAPSGPSCPLEPVQRPCRRPRWEWQHRRQQVRPCCALALCVPVVGPPQPAGTPPELPCGTAPLAGAAAAWPPVPTSPPPPPPHSQAAQPQQQQHVRRGDSHSSDEGHAAARWRRATITTLTT